VNLPEKRIRLLKPKYLIDSMEDENDDIFCTNIVDRYSARPQQLKNMCLAHFAISYKTTTKRKHDNNSDIDSENEDSDTENEHDLATIQLHNNLGLMKLRKKVSVLRYHHISKQKEPEEYFYSQLLLFLPWRNEEDDLLQ
jgi:hypothetical protein